jgi:multidrug efflux pump subunit AcrA (membrane-fusion protein)
MSDVVSTPRPEESSGPVNELFQDLPPYVTRGVAYLSAGILLAALIFSCIGEVDEIATCPGVVAPLGQIRPVQAIASGQVTRVAVLEGERVVKGQVLVYLETNVAQSQLDRAEQEGALRQAQLQELLAARADAVQIADARARVAQSDADRLSARRTLESAMIVAPAAGQVTRLSVRGPGEAVQAGQMVAEVAPRGASLVLDARANTRDIGRIKLHQRAKIKVDAFPHQSYGALEGTVDAISPDAVADPSAGPAYRVTVAPQGRRGAGSDKEITLRLGLTATVEIVTGRKKIIELFVKSIRGEN